MRQLAFAFDIDGVLLRGSKVLARAPKALQLLNQSKIPWILLTNGGGVSEADRAVSLSKSLGVTVDKSQILQSHTPFQQLANKYKKVLIVGGHGDNCRRVAHSYGFHNVVLPVDIIREYPSIWPYHRYQPHEIEQWSDASADVTSNSPFDAVFVFHDSRDMGSDTQIILDLALSDGGVLGTRRPNQQMATSVPSVPIHFSNNDLVWATDYPLVRYGQGAFRHMVAELYYQSTGGHKLEHSVIGKPSRLTYEFADHLIRNLPSCRAESNTGAGPSKVYMIGDNPASDLAGADAYGWDTVLVRTGVYKDGDDLVVQPQAITDDVLGAVEWALSRD